MPNLELDRLEKISEGLALAFGVLMFVALVMALAGSSGSAFLMLILGAAAHVGRAGLLEYVDSVRTRERRRVRLRG